MPLPSQRLASRTGLAPQRSATSTTRAGPLPTLPDVLTRRSMTRVMWWIPDLPAMLADQLWDNPDGVLATGAMLKDGDRCTVVRLSSAARHSDIAASDAQNPDHQNGDLARGPLTLKRYNLKTSLHTAIHLTMRSRARWSWLNGRRLVRAGLPTPLPLACIEERQHGLLHLRSYLLSSYVPGRSLLEVVESSKGKSTDLAALARQFARIWQTLGQLRAGHGDMKATNFIVDPHGKLWLIDLDGLRIHRSGMLLRRERRNDLVRFMRNWQNRPDVAAVFRARIGTG